LTNRFSFVDNDPLSLDKLFFLNSPREMTWIWHRRHSIDENGNYEATLPVGEVQVSVDNRPQQPLSPKPAGVPAGLPPQARNILSTAKASGASSSNNPSMPT
jgi:hypothetical protein